jgi:hypothetical protein
MQNKKVRESIPGRKTALRGKAAAQSIKTVYVGGVPITLKWIKSLQCWCRDPNNFLKARREKAKHLQDTPWRIGSLQNSKAVMKQAARA